MPKFKDLIADYCLHRIANRESESKSTESKSKSGEGENSTKEWQTLTDLSQLAQQRGDQIKQMKATEKKRAANHRKLKKRLLKHKKLVNTQKKKNRRLGRRTRVLRDGSQTQRKHIRYLEKLAAASLCSPHLAPQRKSLKTLPAFVERYIWRYWMRLGVLLQYAPEPLQIEPLPRKKLPSSSLPSISIVTPSYMQADYLEATIESITDQNYPRLDYIIMDGGSTDESSEIIKRHASHIAYSESKPDKGQADAVKRGFIKSTGEIMAWLNSDDLYLPGLLHLVGEYFSQNPDVDVIYGNRIIVDEHGDEVGRWILPGHDGEMLLWNDYIPQETMFWRRSLYEKVGGIDDSFQFALDWDLLLRFHRAGARMVHLPYFMACFRAHESQKSAAWIGSIGRDEIAGLRKRELGNQFTEKKLQHHVNWFQLKAVLHSKLAKLRFLL